MRYASTTATLALLLAVTSTFAAPVPSHIRVWEDVEIAQPAHHDEHHHHRHHHHHHHHHHRVSLAKWIHDHLHYPHHWPFHPHHETQSHHRHHNHHHHHVAENNEQPKKSGSMLLFWLHSHFAPHTSKLRSHRGKPLSDMNQSQRLLSSSFDDKPPSDQGPLKARGLETHSTSESEGEGSDELHNHLKGLHKAGQKLHKLGKMVEKMGEVNDAVGKMHLRIGMAAAKLGHMGEHEGGREIDELD